MVSLLLRPPTSSGSLSSSSSSSQQQQKERKPSSYSKKNKRKKTNKGGGILHRIRQCKICVTLRVFLSSMNKIRVHLALFVIIFDFIQFRKLSSFDISINEAVDNLFAPSGWSRPTKGVVYQLNAQGTNRHLRSSQPQSQPNSGRTTIKTTKSGQQQLLPPFPIEAIQNDLVGGFKDANTVDLLPWGPHKNLPPKIVPQRKFGMELDSTILQQRINEALPGNLSLADYYYHAMHMPNNNNNNNNNKAPPWDPIQAGLAGKDTELRETCFERNDYLRIKCKTKLPLRDCILQEYYKQQQQQQLQQQSVNSTTNSVTSTHNIDNTLSPECLRLVVPCEAAAITMNGVTSYQFSSGMDYNSIPCPRKPNQRQEHDYNILNQRDSKILDYLLDHIDKTRKLLGTRLFMPATGRAMMGSIAYHGRIPAHEEINFYVLRQDLNIFLATLVASTSHLSANHQIRISKMTHKNIFKIYLASANYAGGYPWKFPNVDIIEYGCFDDSDDGGEDTMCVEFVQAGDPLVKPAPAANSNSAAQQQKQQQQPQQQYRNMFPKQSIFPLVERPFGKFSFPAFRSGIDIALKKYGPTWYEKSCSDSIWDHKREVGRIDQNGNNQLRINRDCSQLWFPPAMVNINKTTGYGSQHLFFALPTIPNEKEQQEQQQEQKEGDEEVVKKFMSYLLKGDPKAIQIHNQYEATKDSTQFLNAAREMLLLSFLLENTIDAAPTPAPTSPSSHPSITSLHPDDAAITIEHFMDGNRRLSSITFDNGVEVRRSYADGLVGAGNVITYTLPLQQQEMNPATVRLPGDNTIDSFHKLNVRPIPYLREERMSYFRNVAQRSMAELNAEVMPMLDRVEEHNNITTSQVTTNHSGEQHHTEAIVDIDIVAWSGGNDGGLQLLSNSRNSFSQSKWQQHDIIVLTGMDWGMGRSGNVHTVRSIADQLSVNYAFGVEFLECFTGRGGGGGGNATANKGFEGPGSIPLNPEGILNTEDHNAVGFTGNAILSKWRISDSRILRLHRSNSQEENYYGNPQQQQNANASVSSRRLGGNMALFSVVHTSSDTNSNDGESILVISLHLPCNLGAAEMTSHAHTICAEINRYYSDFAGKVYLGGDLCGSSVIPEELKMCHERDESDSFISFGDSHQATSRSSEHKNLPAPHNNTDDALLSDYCQGSGSLHQIALEMANFSSPPGSPSYQKTQRVLHSAPYYHFHMAYDGIFVNVADNIGAALESFGLQPVPEYAPSRQAEIILVEVSVDALWFQDPCKRHRVDCKRIPRIILQSEQMQEMGGKGFLERLQECHQSPLCVIWDFSDHHHLWATQQNIADSMMLLPIMHQSRFNFKGVIKNEQVPVNADINLSKLTMEDIVPLSQRKLDMVFFASGTKRREGFMAQAQTHPTARVGNNGHRPWLIESYEQAKVCPVVHAYSDKSGGEYHRLYEMATSCGGCVPVMEDFADTIGQRAYQECGGVIFAPHDKIWPTTQQVLQDIAINKNNSMHEIQQKARWVWWMNGVRWADLLIDIFGDPQISKTQVVQLWESSPSLTREVVTPAEFWEQHRQGIKQELKQQAEARLTASQVESSPSLTNETPTNGTPQMQEHSTDGQSFIELRRQGIKEQLKQQAEARLTASQVLNTHRLTTRTNTGARTRTDHSWMKTISNNPATTSDSNTAIHVDLPAIRPANA